MKVIPAEVPGVLIIEPKVFRGRARLLPGDVPRSATRRRASAGPRAGQLLALGEGHAARAALPGAAGPGQAGAGGGRRRVRRGGGHPQGSPTFGKWVGVELSAENKRQFWVPPGASRTASTSSPSPLTSSTSAPRSTRRSMIAASRGTIRSWPSPGPPPAAAFCEGFSPAAAQGRVGASAVRKHVSSRVRFFIYFAGIGAIAAAFFIAVGLPIQMLRGVG